MEIKEFGSLKDGNKAKLYCLAGKNIELQISDYGATLVNILTPDKNGNPTNIVLGYDSVEGYEEYLSWYGCNVGRNANRIGNASFTLNGTEYKLFKNDTNANLHSCPKPYCKRMWTVEKYDDTSITFSLFSPHMDQGYPGALTMYITYTLCGDGSFSINYKATPDQDTIINMTNHSFFNLNGEGSGTILNHTVQIFADSFTPVDAALIPTGEILPVANTPLDFTNPKAIGADINEEFGQLKAGGGYDHNFIIRVTDNGLNKAVQVKGDKSGIEMLIETDMPGLQMYSGNFMEDEPGHGEHRYHYREAVCFEPQFFPDAINQPTFPTPICKAGQEYNKTIKYHFNK